MDIERLKKALRKTGYNQKQLADAIGVSSNTICRYIKERRCPTSYILRDMARALGVTMEYLMGDGNDE